MEPHRSTDAGAQDRRPQHLRALDRANDVRRRRYAIARRVKQRELATTALFTADGLTASDAALIADHEVRELLEWGYRIGSTVSRRILELAEVRGTLKLRALSEPRRDDLVAAIRDVAPDACTGHGTLAELEAALEAEALKSDDRAAA